MKPLRPGDLGTLYWRIRLRLRRRQTGAEAMAEALAFEREHPRPPPVFERFGHFVRFDDPPVVASFFDSRMIESIHPGTNDWIPSEIRLTNGRRISVRLTVEEIVRALTEKETSEARPEPGGDSDPCSSPTPGFP